MSSRTLQSKLLICILMIPKTKKIISFTNKIIPLELTEEAKTALSFYPELISVPIEFRFTKKVSSSIMKAQPEFLSLLNKKSERKYIIFISRSFGIKGKELSTANIPTEVMVGWLGHELGHIMDYIDRSSLNLVAFGIGYLFSSSFIKKAEQRADRFAVQHQMKDYILATKNFILNHTELSDEYKNKIKRLYVSPEEIIEFVNEQTTSIS